MKKIIFCLFLFIFLFDVKNVYALDSEQSKIKIIGIEQDGLKLIKEGDNYIVPEFSDLEIEFDVKDKGKDYYIDIKYLNNFQNGIINGYYSKTILPLNFNNEITTYNIKVCEDDKCNVVFSDDTINLKLSRYNEIKDTKLIISNIYQGDKKIEPNKEGLFEINKKQNIYFDLKGENLIDDYDYFLNIGNGFSNRIKIKGIDLKKGIHLPYYTNKEYNPNINPNLALNDNFNYIGKHYYDDGKNYVEKDIRFKLIDVLNYPKYKYNITYLDGNKINYYSDSYYVIDSDVDSISYYINGEGYEDKNYKIDFCVKKDLKEYYKHSENVNGLLLNKGYKLSIKDLNLELVSNLKQIEDYELYDFNISIDDVTESDSVKYNSVGKDAHVSSHGFYENGKINLSAFKGNGNNYFNNAVYETHIDAFKKYKNMYISYKGIDFDPLETYDYILEYVNCEDREYNFSNWPKETIKTGKVNGAIFNNVGLFFQVDNHNNYNHPMYRLIIKKNNEIIFVDAPSFELHNIPVLANASLTKNGKTFYIRKDDYSYIATRNGPFTIAVSGFGFNENIYNPFRVSYGTDSGTMSSETVKWSGKDLRDGTAYFTIKDKIDSKINKLTFSIVGKDMTIAQGFFEINFVDSKDLFSMVNNFIIDNVDDLIAGIKKKTSVEEFKSNLDIVNDGKIKIYDKNNNEIQENVGTGMVARVMDKYENNILDLDLVVKGDTTGDGDISVTDLVKVSRHLADLKKLSGVYEKAAIINENGKNISLTDLVKISQDVAGIKEVK